MIPAQTVRIRAFDFMIWTSMVDANRYVWPVASDGHPFKTLPVGEPPVVVVSSPNLPDRTPPSPVPTRVARRAADQDRSFHGPMIQTLDLHMVPTKPRKRRRFSKAEKERTNQVRKAGACDRCRKKHRKVGKVILGLKKIELLIDE